MTDKCAVAKRAYSPGQHGKSRMKLSDYATQLREKQKVRRIYGINEHQFRLYFKRAEKAKGITGNALLQLLERRLDNVIYSLGFAASRNQARQIVRHRFVLVNSRPVDIPSYLVKTNDLIAIKANENKRKYIREIMKLTKEKTIPEWLHVEKDNLQGSITRLPKRSDIQFPIQEQLIVELYSK
jgi:small subunit ribosomal protein S4